MNKHFFYCYIIVNHLGYFYYYYIKVLPWITWFFLKSSLITARLFISWARHRNQGTSERLFIWNFDKRRAMRRDERKFATTGMNAKSDEINSAKSTQRTLRRVSGRGHWRSAGESNAVVPNLFYTRIPTRSLLCPRTTFKSIAYLRVNGVKLH